MPIFVMLQLNFYVCFHGVNKYFWISDHDEAENYLERQNTCDMTERNAFSDRADWPENTH